MTLLKAHCSNQRHWKIHVKKIRKTTTDYADRCGVKSIVMSEVNRKGCLQKRKEGNWIWNRSSFVLKGIDRYELTWLTAQQYVHRVVSILKRCDHFWWSFRCPFRWRLIFQKLRKCRQVYWNVLRAEVVEWRSWNHSIQR